MEFTFTPRRGKPITVTAKTARQAAQLVAFKLWQPNNHPDLKSHTQIQVNEPEPDWNQYGVTFIAPGETGSYTFATIINLTM